MECYQLECKPAVFEDIHFTTASLTSCVVILINFVSLIGGRLPLCMVLICPSPNRSENGHALTCFRAIFTSAFVNFLFLSFLHLFCQDFEGFSPLILRCSHILGILTLYMTYIPSICSQTGSYLLIYLWWVFVGCCEIVF